jgi:hypothetical protein
MDDALNQALAELKDIHLPNPISFWPIAPGWYVLLALVLVLLSLVLRQVLRFRQRQQPKQQALKMLGSYQAEYEKSHNHQMIGAHISELLKRVALVYFPRSQVAGLEGDRWLEFLDSTSKEKRFKTLRFELLELPFSPSGQTDKQVNMSALFEATRLWIKERRKPCSN